MSTIDQVLNAFQEEFNANPIVKDWTMMASGQKIRVCVVSDLFCAALNCQSPFTSVPDKFVGIPEQWFNEAPRHIARVAVFHEIGHILYNHTPTKNRSMYKELQADIYSVTRTSLNEVIETLQWSIVRIEKKYPLRNTTPAVMELADRIVELRKMLQWS